MDNEPAFLTLPEAAELLRLSPNTVRRYVNDGRLPAFTISGRIRIRRADIDALVRPAVADER